MPQHPYHPHTLGVTLDTDFHKTYELGPIIGEGAFSKVHSAKVLRGPNRGSQVAVKRIERKNLPREDEEDLLEEVRCARGVVTGHVAYSLR